MKKLLAISWFIFAIILLLLISGCIAGTEVKIIFLSRVEGSNGNDIYSMNPDGSYQVRLARWSGPHWMPYHNVWSADGGTFAYIDSDNETDRLWLSVVDADGQNRRRLLDITDLKMDSMALSPDGKSVVLSLDSTRVSKIETPRNETVHVETTKEYDLDVFVLDVEAGRLERLTNTPDIKEKWPTFSPDGRKIVFVGQVDTENLINVPRDVYVMNADGSNLRHLARHQEGQFVFTELRWSPDSRKIAYSYYNVSISDYEHFMDIFVIDVKNGNLTNLTDSPYVTDDLPSWSPDSRKIAYISWSEDQRGSTWVMDADGKNKTELEYGPPSWTPDGQGFIFTNPRNVFELMRVDKDGKNPRTIAVNEDIRISQPFWLAP